MDLKMFRRAGALVACTLAAGALYAQNNDIRVTVNGQPVAFENARPHMIGSRVLVPLRGVMEQLGAYVQWDASAHTVMATKGGMDVQLRIGDRNAIVNGRNVALDIPAMIIGGSTMVPLRFMGETLGADVRWDAGSDTVAISTADRGTANNVNSYTPRRDEHYSGMSDTSPQQYSQTQTIRVNSFMHNGNGWVSRGRSVHFQMDGTPGGQAVVYIPGVTGDIPMHETSPGHYEADWNPVDMSGNPITLRNAVALSRLTVGGRDQITKASADVNVDTEPPVITNTFPGAGTTIQSVRPEIVINYDDLGSGIDVNRVRLIFNGQDVSRYASVRANTMTFRPQDDLAPGNYTVSAVVPDSAGNESRTDWNFTVDAGPTNPSFSHSFTGTMRAGDVESFDLRAQPGSTVTVSIGDKVRDIPLHETSPGFYHGTYTVRSSDYFDSDVVSARVISPNGREYLLQSPVTTNSYAGTWVTPQITYPTPADVARDNLVVRGNAAPFSTVRIHIDYDTTAGGVPINGPLADITTSADANGRFETRPISLNPTLRGTNTRYTITAYSTRSDGSRSQTTSVVVRQ